MILAPATCSSAFALRSAPLTKLKDEAQVSGLPLNETTRSHTQERTQREVQHYKEGCLLEQIKGRTHLKRFDKQNKFNLDMASKSLSFEDKIIRNRQG